MKKHHFHPILLLLLFNLHTQAGTELKATHPPVSIAEWEASSWTHEEMTNSHAFYRILTMIPDPPSTHSIPEGGAE